MVEFFKYEKGYWYPHMKPRDIEIWERFIAKYPDAYDKCQYDFHIGDKPAFSNADEGAEWLKMGALYQLKIDVLGYKGDHIDLIEVKPSANPASIGQLVGYRSIYLRDEKPSKPVFPVIVTDELRLNMDFLCKEQGITLYVV